MAGYETTATILSFCTYELAFNQNIQQKPYEEVKYLTRNVDYWSKRGINGPKPVPIFGNLLELYFTRSKIITEIKWFEKYGKIYGYIGETGPILTVAEPELIKQILVKDFHILANRKDLKILPPDLSKILVNLNGDDWKRVRSITTPTFTSGKIKRMYPLMKQCVEDFAEYLRPLADQRSHIDVKKQFGNITLDMISTCAFATKLNVHNDTETNMYVKYATAAFNSNKLIDLVQMLIPNKLIKLLYILGLFKNLSADFFIKHLQQLLKNRRNNRDKQYNDLFQLLIEAESDDKNMINENDINEAHHVYENAEELEYQKRALNLRLINKKLTEEEIISQSILVLLAGFATTAVTLSLCLYELALNQDCQQKLYDEIKCVIDSNGQISYNELSLLPYLDSCLMETLRLHSPAERLERKTIDDYKLGNTGITLYKGQQIEIPIYAIHHSEEFFTNPYEFNPERFMPENRHNIIPYTYLPFGAGPRNCIGMRFALLEAKLVLVDIIEKYRFFSTDKTDNPLKIKSNLIITAPERVILAFASVILLIYRYLTRNSNYWSKLGINGPKPVPIFGNLLQLHFTRYKILTEIQWFNKYGKIYGYYGQSGPTLTVAEPELIKQIMVKDFHIFPNKSVRKNPHPVMSKNLADLNGDDWKRIRSITTPVFTSGKIKRMYPLMKQCSHDFAEHLRSFADQKTNVDLKTQFGNYTLDVISTCAFATKLNVHKDMETNIFAKNAFKSFNSFIMIFLAQLVLPKIIIKLLYIMGLFKTVNIDFFITFLRQILDNRRKSDKKYNDLFQLFIEAESDDKNMRHENDINEAHHVNEGAEELEAEKCALNIKLDNKKLTEEEMIAQLFVVLMAGYETTATTLSFCTYELALNQDIQQKLYEEVMSIIVSNGQISYDKLSLLPYLDACLMETLRLHSPAQRVSRRTIEDYKLGDTGVTIYKGQQIDVPIYAIHHSEEFYANPYKFSPERFMPENRHNIIPYTYLLFGVGPRNCIGMRFALLEAKLGLAHIIEKYRFFPTDKTDVPLKYKISILTAAERVIVGIDHRKLCNTSTTRNTSVPILIVISFDGFPYDYVQRELTPNLYRLRATGVSGHMISQFITKTFPNHQSIATGFFEESHGIVSNEFYDPKYDAVFDVDTSPDIWWTEFPVTPVWTVNELYGRHSGGYMWPGGHVKYRNVSQTYNQVYKHGLNWEMRIDTIINWLTSTSKPANCIFMYFEEPDSDLHQWGPYSIQTMIQMRRADDIVGYLLNSLHRNGLSSITNLIVLSDHGFAKVSSEHVIQLNDIINPNLYALYGHSPDWSLLPKSGYEDLVYETLLNASKTMPFTIYRRQDIPIHYHYTNNRRILPLFLTADEGWDVFQNDSQWHRPKGYPVWGNHGWDNRLPSMRPMFLANGPAFKRGYYLNKVFANTDLYPLMLTVLSLPVHEFHSNGSLDAVKDLLN
ncbi:uncharacterized protein LOC128960123 [Oppia nitens]|uniref:uncharacterized protein LOC128960123 n=1 Tax=Oppia nitens TaxID=1686743 RepID=UPI0023D9AB7C|nr:uncharacterized protein LOC128960123 [Oppia nitens]